MVTVDQFLKITSNNEYISERDKFTQRLTAPLVNVNENKTNEEYRSAKDKTISKKFNFTSVVLNIFHHMLLVVFR